MGSAVDAKIPKVITYSLKQSEFNSGKYRSRVGITRLYGNSQWHVLHYNMIYDLISTPGEEMVEDEIDTFATNPKLLLLLFLLLLPTIYFYYHHHSPLLLPEIVGLLFSYKHTAIPDESFFGAGVVWLHERDRGGLPLEASDKRYWNEGTNRDISVPGQLEALQSGGSSRMNLLGRKSPSATITCEYTNILMKLQNDCSKYANYPPPPDP